MADAPAPPPWRGRPWYNAGPAVPEPRDAYGDLLRESRALGREHREAREKWLANLGVERREDVLFELEVLLKGLACFANPRNHPGPPRRAPIVVVDFLPHVTLLREGLTRTITLCRQLLGDGDRAFVFQRYLESVTPEDTARTRLLHEGMAIETPERALLSLRHALTSLAEVADGTSRLQRVPFRLFFAQATLAQREISRSPYFNPLSSLEFRPEFDRIAAKPILDLMERAPAAGHRLVALTFLGLFRMLRYLRLLEGAPRDVEQRAGRTFLVLSVLRSDARALSSHLRRRAGAVLAEGYEDALLKIPAGELHARYDAMLAEGHALLGVRAALETIAATLRLELRRAFEHDLPAPDRDCTADELRAAVQSVVRNLRPALQSSVLFLAKSLGAQRLDAGGVFDEAGVRRASSERLRRDVWMFAQILRAFAHKARAATAADDRWAGAASFQFVKEFLRYFRAMGYPLLRGSDYPRFDAFLGAMNGIGDTDLLDPPRLEAALAEAEAFRSFLDGLFEQIGARAELADAPFDRRAAAMTLKLYLGGP